MHPDESAVVDNGAFQLLHSLFCLFRIANADVTIELDDDRVTHGLFKPLDNVLLKPWASFFVQCHPKCCMPRSQVGVIGKNDSLELERNHAVFRIVGDEKATSGIMQVIGIKGPVFRDGIFDSPVLGDEAR